MKGFKVRVGFEIETILNINHDGTFILDSKKGSHGNAKKINGLIGFKAENDPSLREDDSNFEDKGSVEVLTKPYKSKRELLLALKRFKEFVTDGEDIELNECLFFGVSCGNHCHFSVVDKENNTIRLYPLTEYTHLSNLRKMFFRKIKKSKILSSEAKTQILTHYYRQYATQTRNSTSHVTLYKNSSERYKEFNFQSEQCNKGLEWRSINLLGVTTWNEFFEVHSIVYDCIMSFVRDVFKQKNESFQYDFTENMQSCLKSLKTKISDINAKNDLYNSSTINDNVSSNGLVSPQNRGEN